MDRAPCNPKAAAAAEPKKKHFLLLLLPVSLWAAVGGYGQENYTARRKEGGRKEEALTHFPFFFRGSTATLLLFLSQNRGVISAACEL